MKSIEDQIREGIRTENNEGDMYKTFFVGKNFYVYRFVEEGVGYRGDKYPEPGYVLAWADVLDATAHNGIPQFIPRRTKYIHQNIRIGDEVLIKVSPFGRGTITKIIDKDKTYYVKQGHMIWKINQFDCVVGD